MDDYMKKLRKKLERRDQIGCIQFIHSLGGGTGIAYIYIIYIYIFVFWGDVLLLIHKNKIIDFLRIWIRNRIIRTS